MTKPIPDKAEVVLEYPDKFYCGTFERSSRFDAHVDATGISLYRYMLWNKIRYATNQIMAGFSVNDAAMDAGFTDSSHFHKMMVKMFGVSPSKFLKDNKEFSEVKCEESALHFETNVFKNVREIR